MKKQLAITIISLILEITAATSFAQKSPLGRRIHYMHFDSAAMANSMSDAEENRQRDSIRNAERVVHDRGAGLGERGAWAEHRDPRPDGDTDLYWTNEEPVYEHGDLKDAMDSVGVGDSSTRKVALESFDRAHPKGTLEGFVGNRDPNQVLGVSDAERNDSVPEFPSSKYGYRSLKGEFWGLIIPVSNDGVTISSYIVRWFWDTPGDHPNDATAWYLSVK
jgi:hypothetical protein